ncbi:MAG: hypothetical protein MUD03_02475 [Pirellula sp.]|nr:hypothetical protein [Pirellula sp.]
MRRRYQILTLSMALWSAAASSSESWAQFGNSTNYPVLTYLGRYHGIGYSQGYHACKTGNCIPVSQLYQAPSSPETFGAVLSPPLARDPWPEFGGGVWNPLQILDSSASGLSSLHASPDDAKSLGTQRSLLGPEPVHSTPYPSRPAVPGSPSDSNPRMQRQQSFEPLPAPSQSTPPIPSSPPVQSTNKWLNPAATRYHYR